MNQVIKMIQYASEKHRGQVRKKNGRPYFHDHCLKLLEHICEDPVYGKDEEAALIILGHDIVEDCTENDTDEEREALYNEITKKFLSNVCEGILELTNEYTKKRYPDKNRKERKALELKRLKCISDRGKTLKLYDRRLNLLDSISAEDWNPVTAKESWDLGYHLSVDGNQYIAAQVMGLAAEIKSKCK